MGNRGRPSSYKIETAAEILGRLVSGESLSKICRDAHMPDIVTVYRWMAAHDDFRQNYVRAREEQADTYADEIAEIADRDDLDPNDKRVRIDARKWVAAKLKPKKYSDAVKISGDEESPLTVKIIRLGDESTS